MVFSLVMGMTLCGWRSPIQRRLSKGLTLSGDTNISSGSTHQAEFLVEGLREGTHVVDFDIAGTLAIPRASPKP